MAGTLADILAAATARPQQGPPTPPPPGRLPSLLEFLNPLALPPGETDAGKVGPSWQDVVVPPTGAPIATPNSPLPSLLQFLNPFSAPPGARR